MAHFREISDELYTISTIPGIFDKPDRVVKEAQSVARLPSVVRLLENDFGDSAVSAAIRSALQATCENIPDDKFRGSLETFFLLDDVGGGDSERNADGVTARAKEAVKRGGPITVRKGVQYAFAQALAGELLSAPENRDATRSPDSRENDGDDLERRCAEMEELLAEHYALAVPKVEELAQLTLGARPPFTKASPELQLIEIDDTSFRYRIVNNFEAEIDAYSIAITQDRALADAILEISDINEVYWVSDEDVLADAVAKFENGQNGVSYEPLNRKSAGRQRMSKVRFAHDVSLSRKIEEIGFAPSDIAVYRADFEDAKRTGRYRLEVDMPMLGNQRACSWIAEFPMRVETFKIDLSSFPAARDSAIRSVNFFMPGLSNRSDTNGVYVRDVYGWITRDHGVMIHW